MLNMIELFEFGTPHLIDANPTQTLEEAEILIIQIQISSFIESFNGLTEELFFFSTEWNVISLVAVLPDI